MNETAVLHIQDSAYSYALSEHRAVIRLRMDKRDRGVRVYLMWESKYRIGLSQNETPMEICASDRLYDYYQTELDLPDVRLAYVFRIEENIDGHKVVSYFSEDGISSTYNFEEGYYNFFQMPYINSIDIMPEVNWLTKAVFYQVFVDRFNMGDTSKDTSYIDMKWGDKPTPTSFAGGDIRGIIEKLPYLENLGITAIYLTPIFKSVSNHKYDIMDYMQIDTEFGTADDLKELVLQAHMRGIRVILDAVFNHVSMQLSQFRDVCENGRKSPFFDWFIIDGDYPDAEAHNFECFAFCDYMPKLNTSNIEVQNFLIGIGRHWIEEADIDGWRLDVADEVSHDFWRRFRKEIKSLKKDAVIIGENWHDGASFLAGDQYDSIMNYAFTKACLDYFATNTLDAQGMAERLNGILIRNKRQVNNMMLNLLDSHDTHRFYSEVQGDRDLMLAALALLYVYPGAPCMYYGTEVCLEGGYDPDSRRCMPWDRTLPGAPVPGDPFKEHLRDLITMRKKTGLVQGDIRISTENDMLKVQRDGVTLLINLSGNDRLYQEDGKIICSNLADQKQHMVMNKGYVVIMGGLSL